MPREICGLLKYYREVVGRDRLQPIINGLEHEKLAVNHELEELQGASLFVVRDVIKNSDLLAFVFLEEKISERRGPVVPVHRRLVFVYDQQNHGD